MQNTNSSTHLIPICLVTGFLGSGKTTFLKHIVAQYADRKLVYLVNEFSPRDIDGAIVSKTNPNVVAIPGGSIFCKCLVTEFISQLTAVPAAFEGVEGVVIEASGMANPKVMADMLRETRLDDRYQLANIVSIVDPGSFMKLRVTLPNIVAQIEASDTILINKTDLYDTDTITDTIAAVVEINPSATTLFCTNAAAKIDPFAPHTMTRDLHGEYAKCKDPNYESISITINQHVNVDALREHVLAAEEDLYRLKGYVPTSEGCVYVEYTKSGYTATPAAGSNSETIVLIMRGTAAPAAKQLIEWLSTLS